MKAEWPNAGQVDEPLVNSSAYLMDIAHDFRNRYKNFMTAKTKAPAKGTAPAPSAPISITQATIYVAKHFPTWQQIILDSLRNLYSVYFFIFIFCLFIYNF